MSVARKVVINGVCPTCGRAAAAPFRSWLADGRIQSGCVDHFHSGHLVTPSTSATWHNRPEARKIRTAQKAMRGGFVTEAPSLHA